MHQNAPINHCPQCGMTSATLSLYPMSFDEIDDAKREVALERSKKSNEKRGRKRKNSLISQDEDPTQAGKMPHVTSTSSDEKRDQELRTGRWTTEEMTYCDKLIQCFKDGQLPLVEGTKLNDFLASILKSKQSRLTKKMKVSSQVMFLEFHLLECISYLSHRLKSLYFNRMPSSPPTHTLESLPSSKSTSNVSSSPLWRTIFSLPSVTKLSVLNLSSTCRNSGERLSVTIA